VVLEATEVRLQEGSLEAMKLSQKKLVRLNVAIRPEETI
jgi:hypothetical protein